MIQGYLRNLSPAVKISVPSRRHEFLEDAMSWNRRRQFLHDIRVTRRTGYDPENATAKLAKRERLPAVLADRYSVFVVQWLNESKFLM